MSAGRHSGALRPGWARKGEGYPLAVEWLRDGHAVVVLEAEGGLRCHGAADGGLRWSVRAHPEGALCLARSAAHGQLATGGQSGEVAWWGLDGALVGRLRVGIGWVHAVAWAPDGGALAACVGRELVVVERGGVVWRSPPRPGALLGVTWTPARGLLSLTAQAVEAWTPGIDQPQDTLRAVGALLSLVVQPGGEVVACGTQDQRVHFWRRSTGEDAEMRGYDRKPTTLAFDRSGALLATGGGPSVTVWRFADGGPEGTAPTVLDLHAGPITALAFSQRGQTLASGATDGGVALWGFDPAGEGRPIGGAVLGAEVTALAWRPDDAAVAVTAADGQLWCWRVRR